MNTFRKIVAAAALVGAIGSVAVTAPDRAEAYSGVVGGPGPAVLSYTQDPGVARVYVDCNLSTHRATVSVSASVERGYTSGQWVRNRWYVVDTKTGANTTSNYSGWVLAPYQATVSGTLYTYPQAGLPVSTIQLTAGHSYLVYAQVDWYRGGPIGTSPWFQPAFYTRTSAYNTGLQLTTCQT